MAKPNFKLGLLNLIQEVISMRGAGWRVAGDMTTIYGIHPRTA
jgi:hypothetical protein